MRGASAAWPVLAFQCTHRAGGGFGRGRVRSVTGAGFLMLPPAPEGARLLCLALCTPPSVKQSTNNIGGFKTCFRDEMLRFPLLCTCFSRQSGRIWVKTSHFLSLPPSALERAGVNVCFDSWAYLLSTAQFQILHRDCQVLGLPELFLYRR